MLLNIAFGLEKANAQIDPNQLSPNVNQDSLAFHNQLIEEGRSVDTQTRNSSRSSVTYSGSFTVGGNTSSYYPVAFSDFGGWYNNEVTVLYLGRSNTHLNKAYQGSMIAIFRFHVSNWGNGFHFIDADVKQYEHHTFAATPFVAGWQDASWGNQLTQIIIWLKGGSTYYWHSNYSQTPNFTNGSLTVGGNTFTTKTTVDGYVNSYGPTFSNDVKVRGTIRANEVRVTVGGADFVFEPEYRLRPLAEVEQFIAANRHLPEIAPAEKMIQNGVNMGEFQIQLLQKIEELTLYIIEQDKRIEVLKNEIEKLK